MVREFKYTKGEEVTERKVLVLQENDKNIAGLDLKYLSEEEAKAACELLKEHKTTSIGCKDPIEGYNKEWSKAWRCFSKEKIVKDED